MEERIFITDACVGCAFCMLVCPYDAIEVFGRGKVDYETCNVCMKCIMYCPNSAIEVVTKRSEKSNGSRAKISGSFV